MFAGDGEEAERLIQADAPDLVILDVNLPRKSGLEVCRFLKHSPLTQLIPVIMITGMSEIQDRIRGIDAGADDFLSKPFDPAELIVRVRSLIKRKEVTDELDRADQVLMVLGRSIEAKDPYTDGHCSRISEYSVLLGRELDLGTEDLRALRIAGSVHDIGKVGVPDAILLKRGPLLAEEWAVMRTHTVIGEQICRPLRSFQSVLPIIRHHHERQDGSGYPDGLSGRDVPMLARVMQLADVFDALTTDRPYRAAMTRDQAFEQMQVEVDLGWWDADFYRVFVDMAYRKGLPFETQVLDAIA